MYSRFPREPEKKIRPPANYSGYAFSNASEMPAVAPVEAPFAEPQVMDTPSAPKKEESPSKPIQALLPTPLPRGDGGFGYEDLLILGVILLLASDSGNQELLLWLLLLFFCK